MQQEASQPCQFCSYRQEESGNIGNEREKARNHLQICINSLPPQPWALRLGSIPLALSPAPPLLSADSFWLPCCLQPLAMCQLEKQLSCPAQWHHHAANLWLVALSQGPREQIKGTGCRLPRAGLPAMLLQQGTGMAALRSQADPRKHNSLTLPRARLATCATHNTQWQFQWRHNCRQSVCHPANALLFQAC